MVDWQKALASVATNVEEHFDALKNNLGARIGSDDPLQIVPYRSYGSRRRLFVRGRVLEDEGIPPSADNDSIWRNLLNTFKRIESDEVPGARLRVCRGDAQVEVEADGEGFFETWLELPQPLMGSELWHEVSLELLEPAGEGQGPVRAQARVLVPPPQAEYAVISDIDDTVLQSHATQLLRMARTVFLGNARTRLPFPGVAAFYRALGEGGSGGGPNPLFFVSSSPWNLYDLLMEFFELQAIPRAPTFLRDWGISRREILPTDNREHKMAAITSLLDFYQELPFILIGDSGQQDPEIYREVVDRYPGRVLAVYIRNVSEDLERPGAIAELIDEVQAAGSTLILADDTLVMAEHAAGEGWIQPEMLSQVATEKEADEAEPGELEKLLGEEGETLAEEEAPPTIVVDGDA